jgi:TniQ
MPIVNVRKNRALKSPELRINWGRGRLSGYESFYGFAAKFCRLNQLSPHQFRKFWLAVFNKSDRTDRKSKAEKISYILDEPLYLVESVFELNYVQSKWPQLVKPEFEFYPDKLSFCPLCLTEAYHGCFHEHKWLKKCPIHRVDLAQQEIPYSTKAKPERYLMCLISLLDSNCPGWHLINGKYRNNDDLADCKDFYDYLAWLLFSDSSPRENEGRWIAEIGCNHFHKYPLKLNRSDYFKIKDKLGLIEPIPNHILDLFTENGLRPQQIEIQNFSPEIVPNIKRYLSYYPNDYLIQFFRLAQNVKGENLLYLNLLYTEIDNIRKRHPIDQCDCECGINKRFEIGKFLPGQPQYFGEFMCPYEFTIYELSEKWLNLSNIKLFSLDDNPSYENMDFYTFSGRRSVYTEIAEEIGTSFGDRIPVYQFNWSEETTNLLDIILLKIVQAHIDELKFWLTSIENGGSPANRARFLPNIYLVHNGSGLQLVSWEAGKEYKKSN